MRVSVPSYAVTCAGSGAPFFSSRLRPSARTRPRCFSSSATSLGSSGARLRWPRRLTKAESGCTNGATTAIGSISSVR